MVQNQHVAELSFAPEPTPWSQPPSRENSPRGYHHSSSLRLSLAKQPSFKHASKEHRTPQAKDAQDEPASGSVTARSYHTSLSMNDRAKSGSMNGVDLAILSQRISLQDKLERHAQHVGSNESSSTALPSSPSYCASQDNIHYQGEPSVLQQHHDDESGPQFSVLEITATQPLDVEKDAQTNAAPEPVQTDVQQMAEPSLQGLAYSNHQLQQNKNMVTMMRSRHTNSNAYHRQYHMLGVNDLLEQYKHTSHLTKRLQDMSQRHMQQLNTFSGVQDQLQTTQAAMYSSLDSAYIPPQTMPTTSGKELHTADIHAATRGIGAPPVPRFHAAAIIQEGLFTSVRTDQSFAGSRPLKSTPSASLLFERYNPHDHDVAPLHKCYLRPEQRPPKPQQLFPSAPPRRNLASGKTLANGIPVSRLRTEQSAKKASTAPVIQESTSIISVARPVPPQRTSAAARRPSRSSLLSKSFGASSIKQRQLQATTSYVQDEGFSPPTSPAISAGVAGSPRSPKLQLTESQRALQKHSTCLEAAVADSLKALSHTYGDHISGPSKDLTPRDNDGTRNTSFLVASSPGSAQAMTALGAASTLLSSTAEPMLDDPFADLVKAHFDQLAEQQKMRLQARLNAGLPTLLQAMGVSPATLVKAK